MQYIAPTLLVSLALLVVYSASFVTYYVHGSDVLEKNQKRVIYLLVWLVPLIGPGIIIAALGDDFVRHRKASGSSLLNAVFFCGVLSSGDDQRGREESAHISGTDWDSGEGSSSGGDI